MKTTKHKNKTQTIILLTILCGFIFFFTSRMTLPQSGNFAVTALAAAQSFDDRQVTIMRWDYSQSESKMEVELEVNNNAFDGDDIYEFYAITRPSKTIEIEKVIETPSYIVLHISNLPENFTEISLRMWARDHDSILKLYQNVKSANRVTEITPKTQNEYVLRRLTGTITTQNEVIASVRQKQAEVSSRISNLNTAISALEAEKTFQTEAETHKTNEQIAALKTRIKGEEEENSRLEKQIDEAREKIAKAEEQIQKLGGAG